MTNYFILLGRFLGVTLLLTSACSGAEPPAAPAARVAAPPAGTKTTPAAQVAAPPAGTASASGALPRYVQAPAGSSLTFTFVQEGAVSKGEFKKFATELAYDEKNPAAGSLHVTIQIASLDTRDKDRDELIAGAELFDTKKYPTAQYVASSLAKRADGGLDAVGKLTLRGVTKDLRVPLKVSTTAAGLELSGETAIKRLDYGVGQGEWKSTEGVADSVKLQYKVALVKASGPAK